MQILSNLVLVSKQLIDSREVLLAGGYSEEDAERTVEATGFKTLSRFSDNDLNHFISANLDLMRESLGDNLGKVSLVLVVTQTNLRRIPNAASLLQAALRLDENTLCMEIVDGCNGFVKALHLADRLLQDGEVGVILSGDMNSVMISGAPAGTAALFGDGFALTQVEKTGTFESQIRQRGSLGRAIRFGGSEASLQMDGFEVFAFTTREVPKLFTATLLEGFGEEKIPVFHQASRIVVEQIASRLGYENHQRPVFEASLIGNLGPGSIPSWLGQQQSIPQGSQIVCVGFGSGLSWGYSIVNWYAERNRLVHV